MLRRTVFTLPLVCLPLLAAGEAAIPDFLPPATRAVIGLQLRSVIDSALVQGLGAELVQTAGAKWTAVSPFPGFDPLKDLDEVVIATTLEGDHPPTLFICRGRFPVEEIEKGAHRYRGVPIRQVENGDAIAVIDAGTIVAGDLKQVHAALDRHAAHAAGLSPALARRVDQLSGRYAIWGAGTVPQSFHPPAGGPDGLASLDRFDFGIALTHGLELTATLHLRNPEDTKKLSSAMQFIEAMSKAQPDASGTKIETHVENGTLAIAVAVPEEALKKALEQQKAVFAQALAQSAARAAGVPAKAAAAPMITAPTLAVPTAPASKETQIVSDKDGASVHVTLPGKR